MLVERVGEVVAVHQSKEAHHPLYDKAIGPPT